MRALYKKPAWEGFHEVIIPNTLKQLQQMVGGKIECVWLSEDACVICNEEGRIYGMEYNCEYEGVSYVGPILVVGVDGEEFTDAPMSVAVANGGIE